MNKSRSTRTYGADDINSDVDAAQQTVLAEVRGREREIAPKRVSREATCATNFQHINVE